ncbi:MAG: hypothetical protein U9N76_01170 [Candidatus Marinimicrobia bacterium]|nr:hypothetical protein [Candidatus Neomarinimicrobiota bacterium]
MKKILKTAVILLIVLSFGFARDYNTAVGLRGGSPSGATVKHFMGEKVSLEGIVATRWQGINLTGLFEINKFPFEIENLNWYYGFGAHVGLYSGNNVAWASDNNSYLVIGADAILGIEYNLTEIPVNIGLDIKPAFNIFGTDGLMGDGALSIRYYF